MNLISLPPPSFSSRISAWLCLLRLPNVLTVFGDPLVAFLLAGGRDLSALIGVVLAVTTAYLGGIVMNDLSDYAVDKAERPERPLPSGKITRRTASGLVLALLFFSMTVSFWVSGALALCTALLWGLITAYNFFLKNHIFAGPFSMMLCRVTSLLCGIAAAVGLNSELSPYLAFPVIAWIFYISGLSRMARDEMTIKAKVAGRFGILIGSVMPVAAFVMLTNSPDYVRSLSTLLLMGVGIVTLVMGFRIFVMMSAPFRTPKMVQESVREVIGLMPWFQAAWVLISGIEHAAWLALGLVVCSVFFWFFTRRIPAT